MPSAVSSLYFCGCFLKCDSNGIECVCVRACVCVSFAWQPDKETVP